MQRSSSIFQKKTTQTQSAEGRTTKAPSPEETSQNTDQLDFSSEFSHQETNLNSGANALSSWEDLIDDDWLDEDEDEDEESQEEQEPQQQESGQGTSGQSFAPPEEAPEEESSPVTQAEAEPESAPKRSVEEKLGFEWGAVETAPKTSAAKAEPADPPGPELKSNTPVPMSATRRGGWSTSSSATQAGRLAPVIAQRQRPLGAKMLAPRGQLESVPSPIATAAQLLIASPDGEPGYEECVRLLSRFGLGALRLCSRAKAKIFILDEKQFLNHPELAAMNLDPEDYPVDGAYLVESRSCLIDRRCLTEKPRFFHPALYYFSHALDHAQGGEEFSSRKAAAVLACFEASCEGLGGCDFVDELAASDPVRYFARSVSIYLGRDDCSEPLWTHQDLFDFDRSMYDYLEYLFARFAV